MSLSTSSKVTKIPKFGNKFMRRPEISPSQRLQIAIIAHMAMINREWGTITNIAKQYMISRTFVYMLATKLSEVDSLIFGTACQPGLTSERELAFEYMLSLRLEGRCSQGSISKIMERFDISLDSVGSISQYLTYFGSLALRIN